MFILSLCFISTAQGRQALAPDAATVTILCYLNGDNDLSQEVLHALDMMEKVGSSENVNVIVLVDGHKQWLGSYDSQWERTRLLRLEKDAEIGKIKSRVLEEWGEVDLGSAATLERFIRVSLARYPAHRYIFYTFAHSQGVIDTKRFSVQKPGKALSISRDTSNRSQMSLDEFHGAIKRGLMGRRFDVMVLFSCLANMVEVGYTLSDITNYLVGSEDEIRLLNQPAGSYQIRGLRFEETIAALHNKPWAGVKELGRQMVDSHVENYRSEVVFESDSGSIEICRFSAGMALVDSQAMPQLVAALDLLAQLMIRHFEHPGTLDAMSKALSETPRFASFLNLEYYDLKHFVQHLKDRLRLPDVQQACDAVIRILSERVLIYVRNTRDCDSSGMSIYISNPLVPENIYRAHQSLYAENRFSRHTQWNEMIDIFRQRSKASSPQ